MKLDFNPENNVKILDRFISNFIGRIYDLRYASKIIKNIHSLIFFKLGLIKSFDIKLKSGKIIKIRGSKDYRNFWNEEGIISIIDTSSKGKVKLEIHENYILIFYNKKAIKFYFRNDEEKKTLCWALREEFAEQQYRYLDVKNKDVLDIGAYVGDSAIYFGLKGAKKVYAFEPYNWPYLLAKKNIKENNLFDKISIFNSGIGGHKGFIFIDRNFKSNMGSDLRNFNSGKRIRIYELNEIIKKFGLNNAVLKMDCEGCEYGIILNASREDLRKFDQVAIEYHYGYKNLIKKLKEAGFLTKTTRPIHYNDPSKSVNKIGYVGFIYAERIN